MKGRSNSTIKRNLQCMFFLCLYFSFFFSLYQSECHCYSEIVKSLYPVWRRYLDWIEFEKEEVCQCLDVETDRRTFDSPQQLYLCTSYNGMQDINDVMIWMLAASFIIGLLVVVLRYGSSNVLPFLLWMTSHLSCILPHTVPHVVPHVVLHDLFFSMEFETEWNCQCCVICFFTFYWSSCSDL